MLGDLFRQFRLRAATNLSGRDPLEDERRLRQLRSRVKALKAGQTRARRQRAKEQFSGALRDHKLALLEVAAGRFGARSFADLGCAWRVNGGYGLYCLDELDARNVVLVDAEPNNEVLLGAVGKRKGARFVCGSMGDPQVAAAVGHVDAVILYDVLLHQVDPDWREVLALYAPQTGLFAVYNQQWVSGDTVRLLDLGREEYLRNIPGSGDNELYRRALNTPEEINPTTGRRWRDSTDIWQWGITDKDLVSSVASLGFKLLHWEDHGRAFGLQNFRNRSFIFVAA